MKHRFLTFLLMFLGFLSVAQSDPWISDEYAADSVITQLKDMVSADTVMKNQPVTNNAITDRSFGKSLRTKYKSAEFDYEQKQPRKSVWERIKERIARILNSIFGNVSFEGANDVTKVVLRIFAIVLLAFLLYFVIKYVIGKEGGLFFGKQNTKNKLAAEIQEDIHEINFRVAIVRAESQSDYRSAVRYRFLEVLKKLADKNIIIWTREKTNRDYVREIGNMDIQDGFKEAAYIFDHVWYGEFELNKEHYADIRLKFEQLKF